MIQSESIQMMTEPIVAAIPPPATPSQAQLVLARWAVGAVFATNGFVLGNFASRLPALRDGLGMDAGTLGLVLVGMAIGALCAFPLAGLLMARFGSRPVVTLALLGFVLLLPLAALAPLPALLFLLLLAFGALNGATDVAMNAQGVAVEAWLGRPILGSLHACWSLGSLLGASSGAWAAGAQWGPLPHFGLVLLPALLLAALALPRLLTVPASAPDGPFFALPSKALWGIGLIAFCAALGEGAMADWSAIYLRDHFLLSEQNAALGFAGFTLAMLLARIAADSLRTRFGNQQLIQYGALLAAVGLGSALISGNLTLTFIGLVCAGLGLASVFPLAFAVAGAQANPSFALAAVATMGYTGFLAGPPVIGLLAQAAELRIALGLVVVLAVVIVFLGRR
jgi:MFS family permease